MKFTVKTNKPTGKWRAFQNASHDIKLGGVVCGSIDDDAPYSVRFMKIKVDVMEDGNPNCTWRWVKIKKDFSSVKEAKAWAIENSEMIQREINIFKG